MKLKLFTPLAAFLLASCTSDIYTGAREDKQGGTEQEPAAIIIDGYGSNAQSATRANGQDAADLLGGSFRVYAVNDGGVVFNNYQVCWTGTPGATPTNTAGWEYQGYMSKTTPAALQGIKFWDESSTRYDFVAFSGLADNQKIQSVEHNTFAVDTASMQHLYMSNRVSAAPIRVLAVSGVSPEFYPYKDTMKFIFKRMAARIRVGFYETVAGYAITDLRFYYGDNAEASMGTSSKTEAGFEGQFPIAGDYDFYYDADNVAHSQLNAGATVTTFRPMGTLDYDVAEAPESVGYLKADGSISSTGDKVFLGDNSAKATYAYSDEVIDGVMTNHSQWHPVMPFEDNATSLHLRCDYTLVTLDGTKDVLHVIGAEAYVPEEYCRWQPNYAYTYLFKISDRTGYTSDDSPQGLYPITFDAVVIESEDVTSDEYTL